MIHVVVGTKAQLIKMAPVMWALRDEGMAYRLILTGQHAETMDAMREDFRLPQPDVILHEQTDVVSPMQMAGWIARLIRLTLRDRARVFGGDRSGIVLVHGDALSALVGALIGRCAGLRVAHVEAGLRSFRWFEPFPEEITRIAVGRLSHILFCPAAWAAANVAHHRGKIVIDTHGNTLRDTLRAAVQAPLRRQLPAGPFAVCTIHRYENVFDGERFARLIDLVCLAAEQQRVLFVLHPPTARNLDRFGLRPRLASHVNIVLQARQPYFDFAQLLRHARFLLTDGGSNQEEAFYLGLPCLLLRTATERHEGLGENAVVSRLERDTVAAFVRQPEAYRRPFQLDGESPSGCIARQLKTLGP